MSAETELDDGTLDVVLTWEAPRGAERDVTVFVHVYDEDHRLVAQQDGYPIGEMFPPERWRSGDRLEDRRRIVLPADTSGELTVAVGAYDRVGGNRERAIDPDGAQFRDDAVRVGRVEVAALSEDVLGRDR